jgi:hypothetical protein
VRRHIPHGGEEVDAPFGPDAERRGEIRKQGRRVFDLSTSG